MVKTAALSIRVSPELKDVLDRLAGQAGLSVASYTERALKAHTDAAIAGAALPKWILTDPEVVHTVAHGPRIKLAVAQGWPVAVLPREQAESLGKQLLHAAQVAGITPGGSVNRIQDCVRDIVEIAGGQGNKQAAMKTRVDKFFDDLAAHIKDWPNQDPSYYISQLDDALTAASTSRATTAPTVSDLLEKAIDYVGARRRRR